LCLNFGWLASKGFDIDIDIDIDIILSYSNKKDKAIFRFFKAIANVVLV